MPEESWEAFKLNAFEREIWASLKQQARPPPRNAFIHRFAHKRYHGHPADFMLQVDNRFLMLECKSVRNKSSFECRYLRSEQIDFLQSIEINHAIAEGWVIICDRSRARRHKAYALRINDYLELVRRGGRKSIPWTTLESNAYFLQKTHDPLGSTNTWDLSCLLDL